MQGPGRPDIVNAGSAETRYRCPGRPDIVNAGSRPDIVNAGSWKPVRFVLSFGTGKGSWILI
ncbi:unnamed protein product, partial [Staurois parvus]